MFLFSILVSVKKSTLDGVDFTPDGETLISTPTTLESYDIPVKCKIINGGDSALKSSFMPCINIIKTLKDKDGSQLSCIYPYTFYGSALETLDLRHSTLLTEINYSTFAECTHLTTVELPPNLQKLHSGSFRSCTSLKEIKIPDTVTLIEGWDATHNSAFKGCSSLSRVYLTAGSRLEKVGDDAFAGTVLSSFYIPEKTTNVEAAIFGTHITKFDIHGQNKKYFFDGKALLSFNKTVIYYLIYNDGMEYQVPESVEKFGGFGFRLNPLSKITFWPNKRITHFSKFCFEGTNLKEFSMPLGTSTIQRYFLSGCPNLRRVTLTSEITYICKYAFSKCPLLESVNLFDSVKTIEEFAFYGCVSLATFDCPTALVALQDGVFGRCFKLTFNKRQNTHFVVDNEILYCDGVKAHAFFGKSKTPTIKASCTTLMGSLFEGHPITDVYFQTSGALAINTKVFEDTKLTDVCLPNGLTKLGVKAFYNISTLQSVTFTNSANLQKIESGCFAYCHNLNGVTLPASLTTIEDEAFYLCTSFTVSDFMNTRLESVGKNAFVNTAVGEVKLPATLTKLDELCFSNCSITNLIMTTNSPILETSEGAFSYCENLQSIQFSDHIISINSISFIGCKKLSNVVFPKSIKYIRARAFRGCSELESISFQADSPLELIEGECFKGCYHLSKVIVPPNDNKLVAKDGVLMNKEKTDLILFVPGSITTVFVVPYTVRSIRDYAFQDCRNLKSVTIPDGYINSIGYRSFESCSSLSNLFLPEGITEFGKESFLNCNNLKCGSVVYPHGNIQLGIEAGIPPIAFETNCPELICATCDSDCFSHGSLFLFMCILLVF